MMLWATMAIVSALTPTTHRYALVIAYNGAPDPSQQTLRYADDDGVRYYELFRTVADQATLLSVLDDETQRVAGDVAARAVIPTRSNVESAFESIDTAIRADLARGDSAIFYLVYVGHGGVGADREGFVTLHDGKLTRTALFDGIIGRSHATYNHVIIDACDSYFMVSTRGGDWKPDRRPASSDVVANYVGKYALERYPNTGVLVSTAGAEASHEWSHYRAGVFSYEVRSALVGTADINGDGRVDYSEVSAYVAAANLRVEDPKARLQVYARAPMANRAEPLFDLRNMRSAAFLKFAPADSGHFEVEDERGVRYLDVNKSSEHTVLVGLVPGPNYYVRRDGRETRVMSVPPATIVLDQAPWRPTAMAPRDATSDALGRGLYQVAYGPSFYSGFVATTGDLPVRADADAFVPPGDLRAVEVVPPPTVESTLSTQRILAWSTAGLAVASAGGAVATFLLRDNGETTTTTKYNGNGKKVGNETVESTPAGSMVPTYVLSGVAVAAGITSCVLFLTDTHPTPSEHLDFAVLPTSGGAFVATTLGF